MTKEETRLLIRQLTATRTTKSFRRHQGRLPVPASTEDIEREYFKEISIVCRRTEEAFASEREEILSDLEDQLRAANRLDAIDPMKPGEIKAAIEKAFEKPSRAGKATPLNVAKAKELVAVARAKAKESFPTEELHKIAQKFGTRIQKHNRAQFDDQIREAIGVPYASIEAPITARTGEWVRTNVDLIVTVPERYFARIEDDVVAAYAAGTQPRTLAKEFIERDGMAENDARRIARDQTNKLNGQLNQARQESLGVETYTWRCVRDNRVRECHEALEGQVCSWDDPPEGGGTNEDEEGHPGSGICCRCYPEPDLTGLI